MNRRDNMKGWAIFAVILAGLALVGHMDARDTEATARLTPTTYHF